MKNDIVTYASYNHDPLIITPIHNTKSSSHGMSRKKYEYMAKHHSQKAEDCIQTAHSKCAHVWIGDVTEVGLAILLRSRLIRSRRIFQHGTMEKAISIVKSQV